MSVRRGGLWFKDANIARDFFAGVQFDPENGQPCKYFRVDPLLTIMVRTYSWLYEHYVKQPGVVTGVFRTWGEQRQIYSGNEKFKENPWPSVHFYGRGADMRSSHSLEIDALIEQKLNSMVTYDPNRLHLKACIFHDTGSGRHAHLQVHPNSMLLNAE